MITLDKRLSAVAALVRQGSRLADIGTDHAYLPVHLVQSGVCPSAIASDIGAGPLDAARRTVTENGLTSEIALRLGDGLAIDSRCPLDGVIEAFHHTSLPIYAVQWHPERMCLAHERSDTVNGLDLFRFFCGICGGEYEEYPYMDHPFVQCR
jgi:tRNA A22 N-methylase